MYDLIICSICRMFVSQVEEAIPGISATDVDTRKDKHFVKWLKSQTSSSGPSSSGPSSSTAVPDSQPSQRVAWSPPPPQMPPPPPPAAAPEPQKWHWSLGITEMVKAEFVAKAKIRLCNTVSDWKDKWELEKTGVLPSLSDLFKMTHATSDGVFVDPASEKLAQAVATRIEERETQLTQESPDGLPVTLSTEEADRIFEELAPRKKGRIVGIGSVNQVARATSSYTSRRDEETSQMKARMDSQQVRLDSLEDLLDVMAVGNPVMQRMLSQRRAALGLPVRDPQESDPTRQQPSNPTDYFDDM
ncbi:hypothetical protein YC2023_069039 [Brassica napus]